MPGLIVTGELTRDGPIIRVVMNPPFPEAPAMLLVDCPLCDEPAPTDLESGVLDCDACCVRLELEDEPGIQELAPAA